MTLLIWHFLTLSCNVSNEDRKFCNVIQFKFTRKARFQIYEGDYIIITIIIIRLLLLKHRHALREFKF